MCKNIVYDIGPVSPPDGEIREARLGAAAGQVLVKIPRQGEGREGLWWGEVKVSEERRAHGNLWPVVRGGVRWWWVADPAHNNKPLHILPSYCWRDLTAGCLKAAPATVRTLQVCQEMVI